MKSKRTDMTMIPLLHIGRSEPIERKIGRSSIIIEFNTVKEFTNIKIIPKRRVFIFGCKRVDGTEILIKDTMKLWTDVTALGD